MGVSTRSSVNTTDPSTRSGSRTGRHSTATSTSPSEVSVTARLVRSNNVPPIRRSCVLIA
ncbi:hypothetical protein [Lentzea indica]|uniref:hypothetical protein n=1 Tax=Lentzea indica TaxID=2604800 RepID=UPI0028A60F4A|nr:hypothetical protein [Lentzea indica]